MKINRLLAGILSLVLIAGLGTPAFAVFDEAGSTTENLPADSLNTRQETVSQPNDVNLLTNSDFETGNFAGWTTFLTTNGVASPNVFVFDTDGDSTATFSAQFKVGQVNFEGSGNTNFRGGGILQTISTTDGTITISADIASDMSTLQPGTGGNGQGGQFILFFDGVQVDSHLFGNIQTGTTLRSTLNAVVNGVTPGSHEVKIEVGRPNETCPGNCPFQYIDNVIASEPSPMVGGEIIPIEATSLILAGAQSFSWMIPVTLSILGIGLFVVSRKSK